MILICIFHVNKRGFICICFLDQYYWFYIIGRKKRRKANCQNGFVSNFSPFKLFFSFNFLSLPLTISPVYTYLPYGLFIALYLLLLLHSHMAGLFYSSSKPTSSSSSSSPPSSPPSSPYSRLLLLVTLLPLSLACFAFVLQWRGGLDDPVTHWSTDHREFPGMASTHEKKQRSLRGRSNSDSGCVDLLGQSRAPSFPYFRDWSFDYQSDLNPKVGDPIWVSWFGVELLWSDIKLWFFLIWVHELAWKILTFLCFVDFSSPMIDMYYNKHFCWLGTDTAMAVLSQSYWCFNVLSICWREGCFSERVSSFGEHTSKLYSLIRWFVFFL